MALRRSGAASAVLGLALLIGATSVRSREAQNYSLFAAFGQPRPGSWLQDALASLSPDVRAAVERRLQRREAYEFKTTIPEVAAFEAKVAAGRRREIEL